MEAFAGILNINLSNTLFLLTPSEVTDVALYLGNSFLQLIIEFIVEQVELYEIITGNVILGNLRAHYIVIVFCLYLTI